MVAKTVDLPNIRKLFVPDEGMTWWDADLKGADAQVVAWESEDEDLKAAFRANIDVHAKNAEDMWGSAFARLDPSTHAWYQKRKENKQAVHSTNYGVTAKTMATILGWTVHEADQFQKRWFSLHPNIKHVWHRKVQLQLARNKTITNAFGYRIVYFDRTENCFTEALAWGPQSTVALVCFKGALQLERTFGDEIEILLQVHDSLDFQSPAAPVDRAAAQKYVDALTVPVPYDDPLIIPWEIAASTHSWGDCHEIKLS